MKGENKIVLNADAVRDALAYWMNGSLCAYNSKVEVIAIKHDYDGSVTITFVDKPPEAPKP